MKKATIFLFITSFVILASCSNKPHRPAPMRKNKWRHGGSVVMAIPQNPQSVSVAV